MKYTKYKAFIFPNLVLHGSGQECNKCTSFGRYIYFEVGTGKKESIYSLINDSVSVRSRDNSIGVLLTLTLKSLAVSLRTTRFNIQKFYMVFALR